MFKPSVVIYTTGRCGSNSVQRALENEGVACEPVHYLFPPVEPGYGEDLQATHDRLERKITPPFYFISIVRDPIARGISSWFRVHNGERLKSFTAEQAVQSIVNGGWVEWGLNWWENQLEPAAGRPIEEILAGVNRYFYNRYNHPNGFGFVFRTENLLYAENVLARQFALPKLNITRQNSTDSRPDVYKHYRRLLNGMWFPDDFVSWVYTHPVSVLAYSQVERESLRWRWTHSPGILT